MNENSDLEDGVYVPYDEWNEHPGVQNCQSCLFEDVHYVDAFDLL